MKETLAIGWAIWAPISLALINFLILYPLIAFGYAVWALGAIVGWVGNKVAVLVIRLSNWIGDQAGRIE